ncbi:50S ribosomal protein L4 [Candidatus Marinamargulisbacteria bacterium SCGC AAA071-K20]|nr:50S ribosomal protein L4 [Candidatus Marinamargulisbacteria bacterium SCGC AAA071-K20]
MKLKVLNIEGKEQGGIEFGFSEEKFDEDNSNHMLYLLDNYQKDHVRVPCASTKTRSMVRGGGAKPYKQKGTGNARRGTNRTPLRRGGGVIFGPQPHSFKSDLNKKIIRKALRWLMISKYDQIFVIDSKDDVPMKTKQVVSLLNSLKRNDKEKILLLIDSNEDNISRAFRNISNVAIDEINFTHVSKMIYSKYIFISQNSFKKLVKRLNDDK